MRVAADGGDLYIDLCNRDWHAVRITAMGWSVVQSPPVRFRRTAGMQPLPFPEHSTSLDALRPFLNVNAGDARIDQRSQEPHEAGFGRALLADR